MQIRTVRCPAESLKVDVLVSSYFVDHNHTFQQQEDHKNEEDHKNNSWSLVLCTTTV